MALLSERCSFHQPPRRLMLVTLTPFLVLLLANLASAGNKGRGIDPRVGDELNTGSWNGTELVMIGWGFGGRGMVVGVLTWMMFSKQLCRIFKGTVYGAKMDRNPFLGSVSTIISAIVRTGQMSPELQHVLLASTTAEIMDQLRNWCLLQESMTAFVVRFPCPFFFPIVKEYETELRSENCCDGSDEYEKQVSCPNTCGRATPTQKAKDGLGQSTKLDTSAGSEDFPHHQQKKFGEDLVSKLKEMKAVMLAMQWLPLFSVLFLIGWISRARASRRFQLRRKKVSKHSLV